MFAPLNTQSRQNYSRRLQHNKLQNIGMRPFKPVKLAHNILYNAYKSDGLMHSYLQELMELRKQRPSFAQQQGKHSCAGADVKWSLTFILRSATKNNSVVRTMQTQRENHWLLLCNITVNCRYTDMQKTTLNTH